MENRVWFDNFQREYDSKELAKSLVAGLLQATVPGDGNQRLFPQNEEGPLRDVIQRLEIGAPQLPEPFDFELGNIFTIDDVTRRCVENDVHIPDMVLTIGGRYYHNVNLDVDNPDWQEISKPENANKMVELGVCRFLDNAKTVIDWKATLPELKKLGRDRKYTPAMMQDCLSKLVSDFLKAHTLMIEGLNANQIANYLMSIENSRDKTSYRRRELMELQRLPGDELRVPLTMARKLIDKIYPEDEANLAGARSSAWKTAILSFLPDELALPFAEMLRKKADNCTPMTDEQLLGMAFEADEARRIIIPRPLKYGRQIGTLSAMAQVQFNSVDNGYHDYGLPLEGYGDPYQAYAAYPPLGNWRPNRPQPPQAQQYAAFPQLVAPGLMPMPNDSPAMATARREAAMQAEAARLEAAQRFEAAVQLRAAQQLRYPFGSPELDAVRQQAQMITPGKQEGSQPRLASGGCSLEEAATSSPVTNRIGDPNYVRKNIMADASHQTGSHDHILQNQEAVAHLTGLRGCEQVGSYGCQPSGSGIVTRQQAKAALVDKDGMEVSSINLQSLVDSIQLMTATLAGQPRQERDRSRDQSYRRGEVNDGRYRSRERNQAPPEARYMSRDRGQRSLSRGRDPWTSRGRQDTGSQGNQAQSRQRYPSRSPGRFSNKSYSAEEREGRSISRSGRYQTGRSSSGYRRLYYPEMEDGVNCRRGYNPEKEKHCTKCYPTAEHHEFLCKKYTKYCSGKCGICDGGHHFTDECKGRVESFPPRVGESHSVKLAKN